MNKTISPKPCLGKNEKDIDDDFLKKKNQLIYLRDIDEPIQNPHSTI